MEPDAQRTPFRATPRAWIAVLTMTMTLALAWPGTISTTLAGPPADPFARFDLPDEWETQFWNGSDAKALFAMSLKAVADLVPVQAGIRYCRCPSCDAPEADDPLSWSAEWPQGLTCRRCGVAVPNNDIPAHEDKKPPPEETIEVLPGLLHHYPYHQVEPERQQYPDERLYLAAKCDYETRAFLAKAALYAAIRHHEQPPARRNTTLARVAAVILLRFAQVYPSYATHYDQPSSPKYFQTADLAPPYRGGYQTAKWDWTGCRDVPLNLVVAYALLRGDPALTEAGKLLGEPAPSRAIERNFFLASARFVRRQPEEFGEASLEADRGLLAVGRLLDDPELVHDALGRIDRFTGRGFYYDGLWRDGTLGSHRQVLGQLDGWIDRLLAGYTDPPALALPRGGRRLDAINGVAEVPMLTLAHTAGSALLSDPRAPEVRQTAWPATAEAAPARSPALLGGAGLARLALGRGDDALDIELRSLDAFGPDHIQRQALRLAVGGRTALGDLDESNGVPSGFDHASASRNTVVVDGLNQRESLPVAREPAPGGNFLFFAADPDFQVVTLDDPRAYPQSTTRYRQTVVASAGKRSRYALSVFEVQGGLQHDQLFHGASGSATRWQLSLPTASGPDSLLAPGVMYVPNARVDDGRWFVQFYGDLSPGTMARVTRPTTAWLEEPGHPPSPGPVRLHLLGDTPLTAVTATGPDPEVTSLSRGSASKESGRGTLLLRKRSTNGGTLSTTFVTLLEPITPAVPTLVRVGRVAAPAGTVVVYVETADGAEHIIVNLAAPSPATVTLADGRSLTTDGLVVRVSNTPASLVLAGGTFASFAGKTIRQEHTTGTIKATVRRHTEGTRGWFEVDAPLPDPEALAGRIVLVRHGDGSIHGWTLRKVENAAKSARLYVREEPGFEIEPKGGAALFYQFPRQTVPGPHRFSVSRIARDRPGL